MRGIPGSGKSTQAREIAHAALKMGANGVVICSTDDFFMIDGKYVFDHEKLGTNHAKNREKVVGLMRHSIDVIIVDNTNIKRRDFETYVGYGSVHGYEIEEIVVGEKPMTVNLDAFIKTCHARNKHGVPLEAIDRMARTFEK